MSRNERFIFSPGTNIDKYLILKLIGQGGYGDIYSVHDNEKIFALKLESNSAQKQGLDLEIKILEKINGNPYFPKYIFSGKTETHNYCIMELLGPSLSNMRRQMIRRCYSLSTTLKISIFMLRAIKNFHNFGIIHRDIKPGNFLLKESNITPVFLIDYGLSRIVIDSNTGILLPKRNNCGFRGTIKYASINAHENLDLSWKDDLISWIYSIVELIDGRLPWVGGNNNDKVKRMKQTISPRSLFYSLPSEFLDIWRHIYHLQFGEKPNYDLIEDLIFRSIAKNQISGLEPFDWEYLPKYIQQRISDIINLPKSSNLSMNFLIPYSFELVIENSEKNKCGYCKI